MSAFDILMGARDREFQFLWDTDPVPPRLVNITKRNYERLREPKRYLDVPFGRWSSHPEFWETIVQSCDE